jgi:putative endonuclease
VKHIGQIWERDAERFLLNQGLLLLARNFLTPRGEIDLIMRDQDLIVFVEVRFRNASRFGAAIHSISHRKSECVVRSASMFLQQHPQWSNHPCRFDVIAYDGVAARANPNWIQAAFN